MKITIVILIKSVYFGSTYFSVSVYRYAKNPVVPRSKMSICKLLM